MTTKVSTLLAISEGKYPLDPDPRGAKDQAWRYHAIRKRGETYRIMTQEFDYREAVFKIKKEAAEYKLGAKQKADDIKFTKKRLEVEAKAKIARAKRPPL